MCVRACRPSVTCKCPFKSRYRDSYFAKNMMWNYTELQIALTILLLVNASERDDKFQDLQPYALSPKMNNSNNSINQNREHTFCPTWYMLVNDSSHLFCVCNDKVIQGKTIIRCPKKDRICLLCEEREESGRNDLNISVSIGFCLTYNFSTQQYMLADVPYRQHFNYSNFFLETVPSSVLELNGFMCSQLNRFGDLCDSCANTYGPNMFETSGYCTKVRGSWLRFLSIELAPPTLLFFLILCCKIRATTGPLNAFIIFCQLSYIVSIVKLNASSTAFGVKNGDEWDTKGEEAQSIFFQVLGSLYALWYSQYVFIPHFTTSTIVSTIQVMAIQYLPALYPLFLVMLSYTIVRLHYNGCRVLVYMWRPFQYCKSRLGINWEPLSSIIHTFATFFLLVYTKIIVVSFSLLTPSSVYNKTGKLPYKIVYYDASIRFLSHQHLPYVILALSMLTIFCGLPVLVLFLYPTACFQRFLSKTTSPHIRQMLRIFTEAYTGCYKDKTMPHQSLDCRYFASLYFLFRVVYLACLFFVRQSYMWLVIILCPLLISFLFAFIQPYKKYWLNIVDSAFFALVGLVTFLFAYNIYIAKISLWIPKSFSFLPLLYILVLISFNSFKIFQKVCVEHRAGQQENVEANEEQRMFQCGREGATENSLLINQTHGLRTNS